MRIKVYHTTLGGQHFYFGRILRTIGATEVRVADGPTCLGPNEAMDAAIDIMRGLAA